MPFKLYLLLLHLHFLTSSQTELLMATWTCFLFLSFLTLFCQLWGPFFHCIASVRPWLLCVLFTEEFSGVPSQKKISSSFGFLLCFFFFLISDGIHIWTYIMIFLPYSRQILLSILFFFFFFFFSTSNRHYLFKFSVS